MNAIIKKGLPSGKVTVPPSKSYAHRFLISAALSKSGMVRNIDYNNDIVATLESLKALGFMFIKRFDSIEFIGFNKEKDVPILNAYESASTLRFLIPVALTLYNHIIFKGSEKLFKRGLDVYEDLFKEMNIEMIKKEEEIELIGSFKSGNFKIKGDISSQYFTGLFFALPLMNERSEIEVLGKIESKPYIDLTIYVLNKHGIDIKYDNNKYIIDGFQSYSSFDAYIEGDMSNAAFIDAFNYLGGEVELIGLNTFSLQGDYLYKYDFEEIVKGNATIDIRDTIDLGPILFAFSSLFGGAHFKGTKRLEIKESNRAKAMKDELKKVGIDLDIKDDEVIVKGELKAKDGVIFDSHNDHRILMALSILSSKMDIKITNIECVNKSYPAFFNDLKRLNMVVIYE